MGGRSEQFENYELLKKKASIQVLLKLQVDTNSIIACYAGWGLIAKGYKDLPSILSQYLDNDKTVITFQGCIKYPDRLSEIFYHRYRRGIKTNKLLRDKTLRKMNIIILYHKNAYERLYKYAFRYGEFDKSHNNQIENLAFIYNSESAKQYLLNWYNQHPQEILKSESCKFLIDESNSITSLPLLYNLVSTIISYKDPIQIEKMTSLLRNNNLWCAEEIKFLKLLEDSNIKL